MLRCLFIVALVFGTLTGCRVPQGHTDGDGDGDGDSDGDSDGDGDADGDSDGDGDSDPGDCGEADYTGGELAIPDGQGIPYETTLTITGFGRTNLERADQIVSVCVNMEHTWIRDLQMELESPGGDVVVLNEFLGQEGGEVYLGEPDDNDDYDPNPGVGYDYCWTPTATNPPMLEYCNEHAPDTWDAYTLPPGDYQASSGFGPLVGTELNGTWTLRCIDDWAIDNGYIFYWSITFDSSLIDDCNDWEVY